MHPPPGCHLEANLCHGHFFADQPPISVADFFLRDNIISRHLTLSCPPWHSVPSPSVSAGWNPTKISSAGKKRFHLTAKKFHLLVKGISFCGKKNSLESGNRLFCFGLRLDSITAKAYLQTHFYSWLVWYLLQVAELSRQQKVFRWSTTNRLYINCQALYLFQSWAMTGKVLIRLPLKSNARISICCSIAPTHPANLIQPPLLLEPS